MSILDFYLDELMLGFHLTQTPELLTERLMSMVSLPDKWAGTWSILTKEEFHVLLNKSEMIKRLAPNIQRLEPDLGLVLTPQPEKEGRLDYVLFPVELERTINAYTFVQVPAYTAQARKTVYSGLAKEIELIQCITTIVICVYDSGKNLA